MINKLQLIITCLVCTLNLWAAPSQLPTLEIESELNRWSLIASLGYEQYQQAYKNDGQTPLARLALGAQLLTTRQTAFGLELGVQNGNRMRKTIPEATVDPFNNFVRTTIKPMLDLLITANTTPINESLLFAQLKGGIAYRQWQIEHNFINNKTELSGEVQAGFGYPLTEMTSLNLLYQGVFGGNSHLNLNQLHTSGYFSTIPTQHGILLGLSIIA